MTKYELIERTVGSLNKLPQEMAEEVLDFVLLLLKRHEERSLTEDGHDLEYTVPTLNFLNDEEDLYTLADLKEVYPR